MSTALGESPNVSELIWAQLKKNEGKERSLKSNSGAFHHEPSHATPGPELPCHDEDGGEASTEQYLKVGTAYHLDPDNECPVQDQEEVGCSLQVVNMKKITKEAESSGWRRLYFTGLMNIMIIMGRRVRVLPPSQRRRLWVLSSPSDCGNQALWSRLLRRLWRILKRPPPRWLQCYRDFGKLILIG